MTDTEPQDQHQSPESPESQSPAQSDVVSAGSLTELETLLRELREQVTALREGELDAATLESRLRDLNELAARAASTLDDASR
ncbi:MAG: hypothetical protein WAP35_07820 [Solirubrobacterales bacterium]